MTKKVNFSIREHLIDKLLKESEGTGLSKSAIITIALNEYFEKRNYQKLADAT